MTYNIVQHSSEGNVLINPPSRLSTIVEKIIGLKNPNRIYLVNSLSSTCSFTGNKFTQEVVFLSHYNLMVVANESADVHEIQDIIENNCKAIAPLTALVLPQSYYDAFLVQNTVFANSILVAGELLYQREDVSCLTVADMQASKDVNKKSKEALKRAKGFLSSGELLLLTNEIPLAAFMLHQAIEQYCYGTILGQLGINPKTHNLDKLYRLMRFFTFDLVRIFPRDTDIEERLFATVKEAYIASRYSSSCAVNGTDLKIIRDRLRILLKT
jgi:uncharacterized protein